MGAGRKTQSYTYDSGGKAGFPVHKGLPAKDLGGVIFGCSKETFQECITNLIFGLPYNHIEYVQHIVCGMPLFLFNYSDRQMYGIYEAASEGDLEISPTAWTKTKNAQTPYPAQVMVQVRQQCKPLPESLYGPVLEDNYYNATHLQFELTHTQAAKLLSLYTMHSSPPPRSLPPAAPARTNPKPSLGPVPNAWQVPNRAIIEPPASMSSGLPPLPAWQTPSTLKAAAGTNSAKQLSEAAPLVSTSTATHPGKEAKAESAREKASGSSAAVVPSSKVESETNSQELLELKAKALVKQKALEPDEKKKIEQAALEKLKWLQLEARANQAQAAVKSKAEAVHTQAIDSGSSQPGQLYAARTSAWGGEGGELRQGKDFDVAQPQLAEDPGHHGQYAGNSAWPGDASATNGHVNGGSEWEAKAQAEGMQKVDEHNDVLESLRDAGQPAGMANHKSSEAGAVTLMQMHANGVEFQNPGSTLVEGHEVECLRAEVEMLKSNQVRMAAAIGEMAGVINRLAAAQGYNPAMFAESGVFQGAPAHSAFVEGEVAVSLRVERGSVPSSYNMEIYLIGGFNSESWLDTMEVFQPRACEWRNVTSMRSKRSYAAATTLGRSIYVFGGGDGRLWHSSVERYDADEDSWVQCQSLGFSRGSLGGTSLNGRIYAVGGGDTNHKFAEVEWYDPNIDQWFSGPPMQEKRFCVGAASLHGAVFALGGYNGQQYLSTMERFDPRQGSWQRTASMNYKRGSLSAAVLDDGLCALGGFDGAVFLKSVEMYDPRADRWQEIQALSCPRAYGAGAVVADGLYFMGGLDGNNHVDLVERYTSSTGWQVVVPSGSPNARMRSFLSVAAL